MIQKQVYLSAWGDDKDDGLTAETPVLTSARAKEIASAMKHPTFDIEGSEAYVRRIKAELGIF